MLWPMFLLSDFDDPKDFRQQMTIANRKHDVVALQLYDQRVTELPNVGIVKMRDSETGQEVFVDTSSKAVRVAHRDHWVRRQAEMREVMARSGVDFVSVRTDEDYVKALMGLFKRR